LKPRLTWEFIGGESHNQPVGRQGLVAIFLKGRTSRSWAESPVLVKQNGLPPMQPGFLARERQKGADIFLDLLTLGNFPPQNAPKNQSHPWGSWE
jgi:hypothetical protein